MEGRANFSRRRGLSREFENRISSSAHLANSPKILNQILSESCNSCLVNTYYKKVNTN